MREVSHTQEEQAVVKRREKSGTLRMVHKPGRVVEAPDIRTRGGQTREDTQTRRCVAFLRPGLHCNLFSQDESKRAGRKRNAEKPVGRRGHMHT